MGLVLVSLPSDDSIADVADYNNPINAIVTAMNGNLDATNLADNAVQASKLASGAVTSTKVNLTRTVDANGWTVYDFGSFKQYRRKGNFSGNIPANGFLTTTTTVSLPTGMATLGTAFVESNAVSNDSAVTASMLSSDNSRTNFAWQLTNQFGGTVAYILYYSICITET